MWHMYVVSFSIRSFALLIIVLIVPYVNESLLVPIVPDLALDTS